MAKSVVIAGCDGTVGGFNDFARQYDYDDAWGINNCWCAFEGLTEIIAMDDLRRDREDYPDYVDAIVNYGVPVYTATAYPEYPNTIAYPTAEVYEWVKPARLDNTINYALAHAMHRGYGTIGLYGCEFTKEDPEWIRDRNMGRFPDWFTYYQQDAIFSRRGREPGVETLNYLLGRAIERGIEILVPEGSTIFDSDRPFFYYGYQGQPE